MCRLPRRVGYKSGGSKKTLLKLVSTVSNVQTFRNVIVGHFDESEDARRESCSREWTEDMIQSISSACLEGTEEIELTVNWDPDWL